MDNKICTKDGCRIMPFTNNRESKDMKFMCLAYKAIIDTIKLNFDEEQVQDLFDDTRLVMMDERVDEVCEDYLPRR
jgi:hypothetical protein